MTVAREIWREGGTTQLSEDPVPGPGILTSPVDEEGLRFIAPGDITECGPASPPQMITPLDDAVEPPLRDGATAR